LTNVAWWHCFAGIAGDMALASLLDAGADLDEVTAGLEKLPVTGWHLEATKTVRSGLAATQLRVDVGAEAEAPERSWRAIRGVIEAADGLPERARERALTVFARLATAEGRLHGLPPDEVHFHEVGGLDALVDIVGTCLALESLDVAAVSSSPVSLGTGTVNSAHGLLPNPAPAVVELLAGAPVKGTAQTVELTTPTGAALLAGMAESFGPLPSMKIVASGYGAGTRHLEGVPNVLQVVIGEAEVASVSRSHLWQQQDLVVLEANVDDVTGEILAHTVESLMGAGALDAWLVPVVGKKGRPGHVVSVLARPTTAPQLARLLAEETGTLGFREYEVKRSAMSREVVKVEVEGREIRVKVGPFRLKAEYEDCARVAAHLGLPVTEVARRAEQAATSIEAGTRPGASPPGTGASPPGLGPER
jgi:pyridinium-3,5-bisthiocarboxylic acid mononucleotide nickel chelatase